jgi:hypothetical protein
MTTFEVLAITVGLSWLWMDVQTLVASLTTISRGNSNDFNTFRDPFVFKELPKLIECPTVRSSAFSLVSGLSISSVSDARQIFYSHTSFSLYSARNDLFTYIVVYPGLISLLSTR